MPFQPTSIPSSGGSSGSGGSGLPPIASSFWPLYITTSSSANPFGANNGGGVRVVIPQTGVLHDIAIYPATQSGNISVAIYDTAVTTRTRLATSGAVACPAINAWRIIFDPSLNVTAGDEYDFVLTSDNGVCTFARWLDNFVIATMPSGFLTGTGLPLTAWSANAIHPAPATIAEAGLTVSTSHFLIIGRIA